jgi:hypothetical protein
MESLLSMLLYKLLKRKIIKNKYKINNKNKLELREINLKNIKCEELMKYNLNINFLNAIYETKIIKNNLLMIIIINNFINL